MTRRPQNHFHDRYPAHGIATFNTATTPQTTPRPTDGSPMNENSTSMVGSPAVTK